MKLRNARLTLANIATKASARSLPVNGVGEIKERGEDGKVIPDRISGYSITCSARRDTITIKFPLDVKPQWEELKKLIDNDVLVEISFEGLILTPYALLTKSGELLSGISARAQSFQIVSKDQMLDDDIEIEL